MDRTDNPELVVAGVDTSYHPLLIPKKESTLRGQPLTKRVEIGQAGGLSDFNPPAQRW